VVVKSSFVREGKLTTVAACAAVPAQVLSGCGGQISSDYIFVPGDGV
jgi:hypothetical protein